MQGWLKRQNHRVPWTPAADDELRRRVALGQFVPQLAKEMERSQEGIRARANLIGVSVRFAAGRRPGTIDRKETSDPVLPVATPRRPS